MRRKMYSIYLMHKNIIESCSKTLSPSLWQYKKDKPVLGVTAIVANKVYENIYTYCSTVTKNIQPHIYEELID